VQKQLRPALRKAITLLERHGYRYAVIGGLAVSHWGQTRATYNVDIKVLVPDTDYPAARAAIRSAFPQRARPHVPANPLIVDAQVAGVSVDFLLAVPGYEENIVTRAVRGDLDGLAVWICSPEDLIIQKAVAGRVQDWQDIEGILIEQHGRLDLAYVENWLQQFAAALEQPEILRQYQSIQERISVTIASVNHAPGS
jgi:predicted nucleotidyltransferase